MGLSGDVALKDEYSEFSELAGLLVTGELVNKMNNCKVYRLRFIFTWNILHHLCVGALEALEMINTIKPTISVVSGEGYTRWPLNRVKNA